MSSSSSLCTISTTSRRRRRTSLLVVLALLPISGLAFLPHSVSNRKTTSVHDNYIYHNHHNKHSELHSSLQESTSTSSSSSSSPSIRLAPWESWCLAKLERTYSTAMRIKCPFLRRRVSDLLDNIDMILRFVVIRHKSLDLPPCGWKCEGDTCAKALHMPVEEVLATIRKDWKPDTAKGYYITGRLSTAIYRDDCLFDGPDPDMPVRGLRKYLNAASQLFDQKQSRAALLSLSVVDENKIVATWRMNGILRLPWHPALPEWTGTTTYHRDHTGLIYLHEETWDMSVTQAFVKTLLPDVARQIWRDNNKKDGELQSHHT